MTDVFAHARLDSLAAMARPVATTPVTGLRLSAERFLDALEDDFATAADLLATLVDRIRQQRQAPGAPRPPAPGTRD